VVEDLKDLIQDTTSELQEHLQSLVEKVETLAAKSATGPAHEDIELQALLEEKESTQQGLKICAEMSTQIEQWEMTSKEHPQFSPRQSAHKYIKTGLNDTKGSIQSLTSRLQSHEDHLDKQIEAMRSAGPLSDSAATELHRLEETKESFSQCIKVVSEASDYLASERRNVFEDIAVGQRSYNIAVSTVGALFTARRVTLTGRSRFVAGQVNDESFQKSMDGLIRLDLNNESSAPQRTQDPDQSVSGSESESENSSGKGFHPRYGRGFSLAQLAEGAKPSQSVAR
jgi:hypothetical protein